MALSSDFATQKLYMSDTGLLMTHALDEESVTDGELYKAIFAGEVYFNSGMIAENAVIESGAEVGEDPEKCDDLSNWGVTVIGSEVTVGKDAKVAAKLMIDEDVKEGEVK